MKRACSQCGADFTPKPGPGRPRVRCEECRPAEKRRPDAPPLLAAEPEAELSMRESTLAELTAVSRQASSLGVLALRLAGSIDAGDHTASGLAALSRELRAVMVDASANARPVVDPVDELSKRRTTKAASA